MAGFGSTAKPYVEQPFAGRIVRIYWKKRSQQQDGIGTEKVALGPIDLATFEGSKNFIITDQFIAFATSGLVFSGTYGLSMPPFGSWSASCVCSYFARDVDAVFRGYLWDRTTGQTWATGNQIELLKGQSATDTIAVPVQGAPLNWNDVEPAVIVGVGRKSGDVFASFVLTGIHYK